MLRLSCPDHRERSISGGALSQFAVAKSQEQVRFIVRSHLAHLAQLILAPTHMSSEIAADLGNRRAQQPAKAVDRMRANRAQRPAALLDVRPPIPWPVGIGTRISAQDQPNVSHFADLATAQKFVQLHSAS